VITFREVVITFADVVITFAEMPIIFETWRDTRSWATHQSRRMLELTTRRNAPCTSVDARLTILLPTDAIQAEDVQLGATAPTVGDISARLTLREARDEFEKQYILARLKEFGGNVSRTADALGVERRNLYRKLDAYGIRVERA